MFGHTCCDEPEKKGVVLAVDGKYVASFPITRMAAN
jgi:hypothetical protein